MDFEIRSAYGDKDAIRALFTEYTAYLVEQSPEFGGYLKLQNYDAELEHLEAKYGEPQGRLYIALNDGRPAGCGALRRIDDDSCEMKRMYVRPEYRGEGLGKRLAEMLISDAKAIGYRCMLLDTLPFLETAIGMYRRLGFYDIQSYNNSPMDGLVYLKLDLD